MDDSFLLFAVVGFLVRLVDGTLGMAYGVISSTVLLSFGVPPASASALLMGHWEEAEGLASHAWAVAGLLAGGVVATPLAGYVTRVIPARQLMVLVGVVISALAAHQVSRLL